MKLLIQLTDDDIRGIFDICFISAVGNSAIWNQMYRKRMMEKFFTTPEDRKEVERIIRQANAWFIEGIPASVTMTQYTYDMWKLVEAFCWRIAEHSERSDNNDRP